MDLGGAEPQVAKGNAGRDAGEGGRPQHQGIMSTSSGLPQTSTSQPPGVAQLPQRSNVAIVMRGKDDKISRVAADTSTPGDSQDVVKAADAVETLPTSSPDAMLGG